jgi:hypothetical protein
MNTTNFEVRIDTISDDEWNDLLNCFEDSSIYQTSTYGLVRWGKRNLSRIAIFESGVIKGMAQLRIIKAGLPGCGIAYIRSGPLCQSRETDLSQNTASEMTKCLHDEYVRKRGLYLRVLPNAYLNTDQEGVFQRAFQESGFTNPKRFAHERTFVIDLSPPIEQLRKNLAQKWRNQLNQAERNNLSIQEGQGLEEYGVFLNIYEKMWNSKRFETSVDVKEFARICAELPKNFKLKILICYHEGLPVSGVVCSATGNKGIYLLGATLPDGKMWKGAYILQWKMIEWLKNNGYAYYDLGGIDPEKNPGVYHFKNGLSGQDVNFLPPFDACENPISRSFMKLIDFIRLRPPKKNPAIPQ